MAHVRRPAENDRAPAGAPGLLPTVAPLWLRLLPTGLGPDARRTNPRSRAHGRTVRGRRSERSRVHASDHRGATGPSRIARIPDCSLAEYGNRSRRVAF